MWCGHDLNSSLNNFITKENRLQAKKKWSQNGLERNAN